MEYFDKFLKSLDSTWKGKLIEQSGTYQLCAIFFLGNFIVINCTEAEGSVIPLWKAVIKGFISFSHTKKL